MTFLRIAVAGLLWAAPLLAAPLAATAQRARATRWENGALQGNTKTGVWEYYSYAATGERVVSQRYDHSTARLLYSRPDDQFYRAETSPGQWQGHLLTQPPWFVGGHEALAAYVGQLRYPAAAENHQVEGKVVVSFVVDTLGRLSQHRVVRGIGSGCDEEALRVSRTIPDAWVPGRLGTRAVAVVYELPFTFRLK